MSVTEDVYLPDQPASGGTYQVPLGGEGLVAPIHRTDVTQTLTGDLTGGVIRHRFVLDKRHSYVLNLLSINTTDPGADVEHTVVYGMRSGVTHAQNVTGAYYSWGSTPRSRVLVAPPSMFFPPGAEKAAIWPYVQVSTENVNGLVVTVTAQLLGFDVEALREVPYGVLVGNKPF